MNIQTLTLLLRNRWEALKTARDEGQSSTELAVLTGSLLLIAGLVVVAIRTNVLEKIGVIEGG